MRELFPVTETYTYLDHAAVGPISTPVRDAIQMLLTEHLAAGVEATRAWATRYEAVKAAAARVVNGIPANIAFTQNTSTGLSLAANGLPWRDGDNVVLPEREFPSNYYGWKRLGELDTRDVDVRLVPAPAGHAEVASIAEAIDTRTRVVAISAVQFSNGHRYPLQQISELCRAHDALLVVDGTQAVGALDVDVERDGIDVLAVSGHKWLMAPLGIGFVHFSDRALDCITPSVLGWLSVSDPFAMDYSGDLARDASRFEPGTENSVGIVGLGASLDLVERVGTQQMEAQVLSRTAQLHELIREHELQLHSPAATENRSGIVIFSSPRASADAIHQRLTQTGVLSSVRGAGIRLSAHFYNTDEELRTAISEAAAVTQESEKGRAL